MQITAFLAPELLIISMFVYKITSNKLGSIYLKKIVPCIMVAGIISNFYKTYPHDKADTKRTKKHPRWCCRNANLPM